MRTDPPLFRALAEARTKEPRFVVLIEFPSGSLYVTSHPGISGVPGVVLAGCLAEPNVVSQRLNPDEGRAEIGSASFRLVDVGSQFTTEIRAQLGMGRGLRNRRCRFYMGFAGQPWSDFQLIATQDVSGATFDRGAYSVECRDVQRSARKDVFTLATTTLAQSITATDTTIFVGSTTGFARVYHGASYSDAPGATVGYIKIKDEVIRYTGTTATSFTGCTRGVLGTTAAAYAVDANTPASRREKVTEHVYLELPGPKLLYALLTGVLHNDSATLPSTWHLGIPTDLIRLSDFTGIGPDLWDLTNDANGVVLRFLGIGKTDGKKFYEEEILRLLGLFAPVYADGTLGLRRMTRVLSDSAGVATLDESNCVQVGALEHDMQSLRNVFTVEWNPAPDGRSFTRQLQLLDANSVTTHGRGEELKLAFRGLWGGRHTDSTVFRLIDGLRDRYAAPPERITVDVLHGLNRLEVGDVVRLKLEHVRDYAGTVTGIDRAFEVQSIAVNHRTGKVTLDLFGSTAPASALSPTVSVTALPDAFYSAAGQPLTNVVPVTAGVAATGTYNLVGGSTLDAGIFYHLGDLTIPQGTTLNISGNVQLRVRGYLTLNGIVSGVGAGRAGVADTNTTTQPAGSPGFVGHSRGWDGINVSRDYSNGPPDMETVPAQLTRAAHSAFPVLTLEVGGNALRGLPTDLRGTGGAPGGRILTSGVNIQSLGGAGANGGAGLAIVARGIGLGVSSSINLSGNSSAATSVLTPDRNTYAAGPGGAGGPGALLVLLDGSLLSAPDFSGRFVANTGNLTLPSGSLPPTGQLQFLDNGGRRRYPSNTGVWMGYPNPDVITGRSLAGSALRIQYVPAPETPSEDVDSPPPAPTALATTSQPGGIQARATLPDPLLWDVVEFWASIDNNRANAVKVAELRGDTVSVTVPAAESRWFWIRTKQGRTIFGTDNVSAWFPAGATAGVQGTALAAGAGADGRNGAVVYIYQRASSAPALPSVSTTYTFATGALTGLNNGWLQTIPAGTDPVWVSTATASATTSTDTIAAAEWATPVILAQNGANGSNGAPGVSAATVYLFQRTASATPPSLPNANVTYTFSSGAASGLTNGWSQTLPTSGGAFRWVTTATALSTGATDTIAPGEWAAAALLAQDGANGANGSNGTNGSDGAPGSSTAVVFLFQRTNTSTPPSVPSATTTYTFATGALSDINNGWSQSLPTSGGPFRWVTTATASSSTATDTIGSGEWATPSILAEDGGATPPPTFSVAISGSPMSGAYGNGSTAIGTWTANPTNGTGPYSYLWYYVENPAATYGPSVFSTSPFTGQSVSLFTSGVNNLYETILACEVIDAAGRVARATVSFFFQHGAPP
jgi:hypothetical protein